VVSLSNHRLRANVFFPIIVSPAKRGIEPYSYAGGGRPGVFHPSMTSPPIHRIRPVLFPSCPSEKMHPIRSNMEAQKLPKSSAWLIPISLRQYSLFYPTMPSNRLTEVPESWAGRLWIETRRRGERGSHQTQRTAILNWNNGITEKSGKWVKKIYSYLNPIFQYSNIPMIYESTRFSRSRWSSIKASFRSSLFL